MEATSKRRGDRFAAGGGDDVGDCAVIGNEAKTSARRIGECVLGKDHPEVAGFIECLTEARCGKFRAG
jgi:hypothetical protein